MRTNKFWAGFGLMLLCLLSLAGGAQGQSVRGAGRLDIGGGQSATFCVVSNIGYPAMGTVTICGTGGCFAGTFRADSWATEWLSRQPDNPDDDAATPLFLMWTRQGVFTDLHGVSTLATATIEASEDGSGSLYGRVVAADYRNYATYGKVLAETADGAGKRFFAPVRTGKIQFNFWF